MAKKIVLAKEIERFKSVLKSLPKEIKKKVRFAILFGSQTTGKANPLSDIDVAIYYEGDKRERFAFRLALMGKLPDYFDIKIYQDLPLYIQPSVLRGKLLYTKDVSFVYAIAYETIQRFEDFRGAYEDYINSRRLIL